MIRILRIVLLAVLFVFLTASWEMEVIGSYSYFYELKIGDGRNDGVNRIYASTYSGYMTEWTYNNGTWDMIECGHTTGGDTRIISVWVGDGRNDGLNRIYAASANGTVYEFSWENDQWVNNALTPTGEHFAGITIGDSRNDGMNRVLVGGWYNPFYEYTFENSSWSRQNVSSLEQYIWPMEIGNGRNNGTNRIYCPDWFNSRMIEYSWNGTSYDEVFITSPNRMVKALIADGREDGIQRIYASEMFGHILEFTYENGSWSNIDIQPDAPLHSRYGMSFGRPTPDEQLRLYSVAQGGALREHYWDDSEWKDQQVDLITGATASLTVGDGRDDGQDRVYVAGCNGNLYEYTCIDTFYYGYVSGNITSNLPGADLTQVNITAGANIYHPDETGAYSFAMLEGTHDIIVNLQFHSVLSEQLEIIPGNSYTFDFDLVYLIPPTDLVWEQVGTQANLSWQFDNFGDPDFEEFNVWRRINNLTWGVIAQQTSTEVTLDLIPGLENYFYVQAEYVTGFSDSSNVILIVPTSSGDNLPKTEVSITNYPNPFNPSTTITFELNNNRIDNTEIEIYNLKGQKVRTFSNHQITQSPNHQIIWHGTNHNDHPVSSGIYYCVLKQNGKTVASNKMILIK